MKLAGRLLAMADMIETGESIADIGTDHGLLPIFLMERKISPKVIMTDINTGPLERAEKNFHTFLPDFKPDLRKGNGLEPLKAGEADVLVIAGMGGEMIINILEKDFEKTLSFKKIILQPRTKPVELRKFLHNYSFEIMKEKLVREGKFICEIILARPGTVRKRHYDEMELEISPLLISAKDPLLEQFIKGKMKKETFVMDEILKKGSAESAARLETARKRIGSYTEILKEIGG